MEMTIKFTIPGAPVGKGRPRVTRHGTYTPQKTRDYEELVRWKYAQQAQNYRFPDGAALAMMVFAYYPIPASATKHRREAMEAGTELPTKRPDFDNIAKLASDALNGIAYKDDAQIVRAVVCKVYDKEPRVEVYISEVGK